MAKKTPSKKTKVGPKQLGPSVRVGHVRVGNRPITLTHELSVSGAQAGAWKNQSEPCRDKKIGGSVCPSQFVFHEGKPAIRLCVVPNRPGLLVPIDGDPIAALEKVRNICRRAGYPYGRTPRSQITREIAAEVGVELLPGLGRVRRR